MKKTIFKGVEIWEGTDNVFADLGLPNAEKLMMKTRLMCQIMNDIDRRGLTQTAAAKQMGISQPKLSEMMRGNFANVSERKLMDCLNRLGYDIEIKIKPAAEPIGHLMLAPA